MRKSKLFYLGILLLVISFVLPLQAAQESPRIMLVLDASGSMWGKIEGKTKIEIAREVIAEFLKKLDPNVEIGLVVYGHRKKGDCKDIETLIPIGKSTASKIISTVNKINPKGKTPLSHAVQHAAKELRHTEMRATVVLVSDGVETCDADPCKIGKELAMSGVDFTAHVIGFDVKGEDQVGLRCLASNTGGLFLPAANAGELLNAFTKVVDKAKEAPKPVVEDPGKASVKGPAEVAAGSVFKVEWEGPNSRNDYITIVEKDAPDRAYRNYAYTHTGTPVTITAPDKTGKYELRYVFNHTRKVLARADITVTPVTATVEGPARASAGSAFKVKWTGPDNRADYITIVEEGASNRKFMSYGYTSHGSPARITAPDKAGTYEIRYVTGQTRKVLASTKITVTKAEVTLKAPSSAAAGSAFKVDWTGPDNRGDYITIVPPDAEDRKFLSHAYTRNGSPAKIKAPEQAGEFEVRYITGQSRKVLSRVKMTVTAVSATLDCPASAPAGSSVTVKWTGPDNQRDYITIVPKDAPDRKFLKYSYTSRGSPCTIQTADKPGQYEVRYIMNQSRKALVRRDITLTPVTAKVSAPATVKAGEKFRVSWEGPDYKRDYITIVEAGAPDRNYLGYALTKKGSPATLTAPKKPGKYEVRYMMSQSRTTLARTPITVE
ncbi:MAG: VWA domain-containing protein [bacterium]|nr:VWA domain-containing protein [bacterium]